MDDQNKSFFKVYCSTWCDMHFQTLNRDAKLIYIALCSFRGGKNSKYPGKCFPSLDKLAKITSISRSKISNCIQYLVSGGFILKEKVRRGKKNICIYTILENPIEPTPAFFEFIRLDEKAKKKKAINAQKARQAKRKKKEDSQSIIKTIKEVDSLQNRKDSQSMIKTGTKRINLTRNSNEQENLEDKESKENKGYWNLPIPTKDDLF